MILQVDDVATPIGTVRIAVHGGRLYALGFLEHWCRLEASLRRRFGELVMEPVSDPCGVADRLRDYFAGNLDALDAIAVDPGGTEFQRAVWAELRRIPCGRTVSYGDLARSIGAPDAVRAAGAANGANPISIVVPCHRVIGADGRLVGYGGGVERKRWLLAHERALLA